MILFLTIGFLVSIGVTGVFAWVRESPFSRAEDSFMPAVLPGPGCC